VRKLILIRRTQPVFQRRKFFLGRSIRGSNVKDISFLSPSGKEMSDDDWSSGFVRCLGVRLAGDLINDETERGEPIVGETLLLLLNGHWEPIPFTLPETKRGHIWDRLLDTFIPAPEASHYSAGAPYPLKDRSVVLLATRPPEADQETATASQLKEVSSEAKRRQSKPPGPTPI
jgi:isoamylase